MKFFVTFSISMLCVFATRAQSLQSENLIIITLDGFRWQEVFRGADPKILHNDDYTSDTSAIQRFSGSSTNEKRRKLMPFFWSVIGNDGQLYGNRDAGNEVRCSNPYRMSYPGYSELLVGYCDRRINSNRSEVNRNATVLEYLHQQPSFDKRVAVFATWSTMPYIIRHKTSNIYVNSGREKVMGDSLSANERLLNDLQDRVRNPYGERFDAFTFYFAFEYLKRQQPRILFISFDETDEHAHGGRYDEYLKSAHRTDQLIGEMWSWVQSHPQYKDKTTMIITTDHGRGGGPNNWKRHGQLTPGSQQTWFAIIGPDTPAIGEVKTVGRHYQNQIAKTAAALLGHDYKNIHPVGDVVQGAIATKNYSARK